VIHLITDAAADLTADVIHVRNKDVTARELLALARFYVERGARVVVNTRCDAALAAGAAGVHLPSGSFRPSRVRAIAPAGFLVGVSCHTREELEQAQTDGADYAYLSPVFSPLSKPDTRPPLGLEAFSRMVEGLSLPVLALGGITEDRIASCLAAGAAGVAGITLGRLAPARDQDGGSRSSR
jgi:thiamine-phosphate diphosphorylase